MLYHNRNVIYLQHTTNLLALSYVASMDVALVLPSTDAYPITLDEAAPYKIKFTLKLIFTLKFISNFNLDPQPNVDSVF